MSAPVCYAIIKLLTVLMTSTGWQGSQLVRQTAITQQLMVQYTAADRQPSVVCSVL